MENETLRAYKIGALRDTKKRSFIGRKPDGSIHLLLWGKDKEWMHDRVIANSNGNCQGCTMSHFVLRDYLQWDHMNNKPWNRCDCENNARAVCRSFHELRHTKREREHVQPCGGIDLHEFFESGGLSAVQHRVRREERDEQDCIA